MIEFRKAGPEDVPLVLWFIKQIAEYEKMLDEVEATEELLTEWLFERHCAEVVFAVVDGKEVGFALYYYNFSTFTGRPGLYLEDIFVMPEHRGKGYGKALFNQLVRHAAETGCGRMDWVCLDWNTPSIRFYKSTGARAMDQWTIYRLTETELKKLAGGENIV